MGLLTEIGFGLPVEPEVRARIEAAATLMAGLGATVEPMPPIFEENPEPDFDRMLQAYTWTDFGELLDGQQAIVCRKSPPVPQGESMSAAEFTRALMGIGETRRRIFAACSRYDYVLTPTMSVEPFAA